MSLPFKYQNSVSHVSVSDQKKQILFISARKSKFFLRILNNWNWTDKFVLNGIHLDFFNVFLLIMTTLWSNLTRFTSKCLPKQKHKYIRYKSTGICLNTTCLLRSKQLTSFPLKIFYRYLLQLTQKSDELIS